MQYYDSIFISNIPAFYKIDLYAKIAKHSKILVIFLAKTSTQRTADFYQWSQAFPCVFLWEGALEQRSVLKNLWNLQKLLLKIKARSLVLGGWDAPEYWLALHTAFVQKKGVVLESSCFESQTYGFKGLLKSYFVGCLSMAFPSGSAHIRLLNDLKFRGKIYKTKGVGIFHYKKEKISEKNKKFHGKFLYVGRLATEKNIEFLLRVFKQYPQFQLTLVGDGPLRESLEAEVSSKVTFLGHVPNSQLSKVYREHDVFILPSLQEPWGLVVEEALHFGLPVIVSECVGCAEEWVLETGAGMVFDPKKEKSLSSAIEKMSEPEVWLKCAEAAQKIDFEERDRMQIKCYWEALLE